MKSTMTNPASKSKKPAYLRFSSCVVTAVLAVTVAGVVPIRYNPNNPTIVADAASGKKPIVTTATTTQTTSRLTTTEAIGTTGKKDIQTTATTAVSGKTSIESTATTGGKSSIQTTATTAATTGKQSIQTTATTAATTGKQFIQTTATTAATTTTDTVATTAATTAATAATTVETAATTVETAATTGGKNNIVTTATTIATSYVSSVETYTSVYTSVYTTVETTRKTVATTAYTTPTAVITTATVTTGAAGTGRNKNGKNPVITTVPNVAVEPTVPTFPVVTTAVTQTPIPSDDTYPHMAYLPAGSNFSYFVDSAAAIKLIAEYNGLAENATPQEGWYKIPPSIAVKVESRLYTGNTYLYSRMHEASIINIILAYINNESYWNSIRIPAGLALNVNSPEYTVTTVRQEVVSGTVVGSSVVTSMQQVVINVPASETAAPVQEAKVVETTQTTPVVTVATTTPAVIGGKKAVVTTAATTPDAAAQEEAAMLQAAAEAQRTEVKTPTSERKVRFLWDQSNFEEVCATLDKSLVGFAIGDYKTGIFASFNEDAKFPVNCTGKAIVATLLCIKCEEAGIPMNTKVVITNSDLIPNTTWMKTSNGYYVGQEVSLQECCYCAISLSDNVGYNVIKRYLAERFGVNVDTWRYDKFGRVRDGGSYGVSSARRMYDEAVYCLDYMTGGHRYSELLASWFNMEQIYYDSVFLNATRDLGFQWTGFKVGWYGSTETEMVWVKDRYGNWYIAIFLTVRNGTEIIDRIASTFDEKYKKMVEAVTLYG